MMKSMLESMRAQIETLKQEVQRLSIENTRAVESREALRAENEKLKKRSPFDPGDGRCLFAELLEKPLQSI